ncbi:MAG: LysM peptidoglycan-binding domain-containing protein [Methylorubrum populi]
MTAEVRRSLVLAAAGLLGGFAMVVALFGTGELLKRNAAGHPSAETPAAPNTPSAGTETGDRAGGTPPTDSPHAALGALSQGESGPPRAGTKAGEPAAPEAGRDNAAPTFDIVRVEPDGASVIAGRAAPNARIDLLRDGKPFATAQADAAGQFALTLPDLPAGTSEIALRATGADGKPLPGRESVSVVVAEKRDAKPLIALSAPDAPTRVLSQPGAQDMTGKDIAGKDTAAAVAESPGTAVPAAAGRDAVRIVSVDAQAGGRLDVTSQTAPGSSLRLYLNDTLVASGPSGADGRTAFTIGRGVKPGAYRIRVDSVDPKGKVRNRAEVAFAYPDGDPPTRFAEAGPTGKAVPDETRAATEAAPLSAPITRPKPAHPAAEAEPAKVRPAPGFAVAPPQAKGSAGADGQAAEAPAPSLPEGDPPVAGPTGESVGTVFVPEISTARITRGDSLWQISRRTYGRGNRYTVIYDANQNQIRDPDLIYPGQMFVLPKDEPTGASPSAKRGADRRT